MARTGPITKDTSTLALGLAQVRVGEYSSTLNITTPVLTEADSLGALADTKLTGSVEYWSHSSGFPALEDFVIPLNESQAMEMAFEEVTPFNLALARGISPFADVDADVLVIGSTTSSGTTSGNITPDNAGSVNDEWTVVFTSATTYDVYGKTTGFVGSATDLTSAFSPLNGSDPYFTIPANYFTGTWAENDTHVFSTTAFVSGTNAYSDPHTGEIPFGTVKAPDYIRMEAVYTFPNGVNTLTIIYPYAQVTSSVELGFTNDDNAKISITISSKSVPASATNWANAPQGKMIFA